MSHHILYNSRRPSSSSKTLTSPLSPLSPKSSAVAYSPSSTSTTTEIYSPRSSGNNNNNTKQRLPSISVTATSSLSSGTRAPPPHQGPQAQLRNLQHARRRKLPQPPLLNTNPFRSAEEEEEEDINLHAPSAIEQLRQLPDSILTPVSAVREIMSFCMPSLPGGVTSHEEPISPSSKQRMNSDVYATSVADPNGPSANLRSRQRQSQRRRHSYHSSTLSKIDLDNINVGQLLDNFLTSLNRRLDYLDTYFNRSSHNLTIDFDAGSIEKAWSTLHDVREACNHVGDEVMDAGRRKGAILIETLESQYKGALARKETMEAKIQESVKVLDMILSEFESRAYQMRDSSRLSMEDAYNSILHSGRRLSTKARTSIDEGLERARRAKEVLQSQIAAAIDRYRTQGLLSYDDLPGPWKSNPHITRGYRFCETPLDAIRSILVLCNETFNIWSHLLGLILMLGIAFYFYPSTTAFSSSSTADTVVAGLFFAAAVKCLACSTLWHTMAHISCQKTMERFACVDYTGISFLVASSIITTEYTAFYCEPVSRWVWISLTTIFGVCGTIAPWHPTFNKPHLSWMRVAFFCSLAATGFLPLFQLFYMRGFSNTMVFYSPILKSLCVYFTGALLYAAKIPEKWYPGAFDFVGGSHNIWHVAVLGGILFHYVAMQSFFVSAFERVAAGAGACSVY